MYPPNVAHCEKGTGITFGRAQLVEEPMTGPSGQTRPTTNTSKPSDDLSSRGIEEAVNEDHHQSPVQYDKPIIYRL